MNASDNIMHVTHLHAKYGLSILSNIIVGHSTVSKFSTIKIFVLANYSEHVVWIVGGTMGH